MQRLFIFKGLIMDVVFIILIVISSILVVISLLFLAFNEKRKISFITLFISSLIISCSSYGFSILKEDKSDLIDDHSYAYKEIEKPIDICDYISLDYFYKTLETKEIYTHYYFYEGVISEDRLDIKLVYKIDNVYKQCYSSVKYIDGKNKYNISNESFVISEEEFKSYNMVPIETAFINTKRIPLKELVNIFAKCGMPPRDPDECDDSWIHIKHDYLDQIWFAVADDLNFHLYDYVKDSLVDPTTVQFGTPILTINIHYIGNGFDDDFYISFVNLLIL